MSGEVNESNTFNYNISGGHGGSGGTGHGNGGTGGSGGTGEGPTVIFDHSTNKILKEILEKWLEFPPDTQDRHYELQRLHHESTGRWLLRDGRFFRWKNMPGSLWIKGISGTGKSVLSSTVIKEIVKTCPNRSAVSYFYFDFRNKRQHMDIMLRSIVWQLSGRSPFPYRSLCQLHKTLGNGSILPQHIDLLGVLTGLLSQLDRTYIVIDGLDECNKTDWKLLVEFINSLCHPAKNALHLLFTSQPLDEFQKAFKDVTFIELGSAVSTADIRSYICSEIPKIGNWASDYKYAKDVTEQIVQKSNGMFRMAACLLIELEHCYEDEWQETLTALPSDLYGIYSRFLTRAKASLKPAFIQAIFRWLVFSARQVTSDELADAIAFRLDAPAFDLSDPVKSTYYPKRRLDNSNNFKLLEGLIVIKKERREKSIAFAHSSVKDYILSPQFHQEFGPIINLTKDVSHKFIAQTCVRYLLLFSDPTHLMSKDTLPDYPISLYAAKYWFHHLRLCNDQDQEALLHSTMCLLEDGSSQYVALYQLRLLWPDQHHIWDGHIPPAVWMCYTMGYTQVLRSLLIEHNTCVDAATKDGMTALHLASEEGHFDFAKLLTEHNASVDLATKDSKTALHLTLEKGHLDIARLLIEHNASVDLATKDGKTALHLTLEKGHLDIARLLIEHNASVDLATKDGKTALYLTLEKGHLDIARLLIEHNASVDLATKDGKTALHLASEKGHLNIARLLTEHNASVDLATKDSKTALHLTLEKGHLDIARLLIEHNASVDLATKDGKTALHLTSKKGHLDIVRLLIKHNASVDLATKDGKTALHFASGSNHPDVAWLLIKHNASINQATKQGRTALDLASERGYLNVMRLLIEHNASVYQTTLHLAKMHHHRAVVLFLIEHSA